MIELIHAFTLLLALATGLGAVIILIMLAFVVLRIVAVKLPQNARRHGEDYRFTAKAIALGKGLIALGDQLDRPWHYEAKVPGSARRMKSRQ